jgi:hypothetical protein
VTANAEGIGGGVQFAVALVSAEVSEAHDPLLEVTTDFTT